MTVTVSWPVDDCVTVTHTSLSLKEIEQRLAGLVQTLREECDGELPHDFPIHLEDIGHALGLDDAALQRVLEMDHLPSEEAVQISAFLEMAPAGEWPPAVLKVL